MISVEEKYTSFLDASCDLIGAITVKREFSATDHILVVKEENWDEKKYQDGANDAKLQGIFSNQGAFEKRLFLHANHTGSLLRVWGTTVTVIVLTATEFRDFLCACYNANPPNL